MPSKVILIEASWYFVGVCVITTECGHVHLRFADQYRIGDILHCPFCGIENALNN